MYKVTRSAKCGLSLAGWFYGYLTAELCQLNFFFFFKWEITHRLKYLNGVCCSVGLFILLIYHGANTGCSCSRLPARSGIISWYRQSDVSTKIHVSMLNDHLTYSHSPPATCTHPRLTISSFWRSDLWSQTEKTKSFMNHESLCWVEWFPSVQFNFTHSH